jgi:hypothetical protein
MRPLMLFVASIAFAVTGCDNKADAHVERQALLKEMYRVPSPSDPAEDQWAKPGVTKPNPKGQ